MPGISLLAALVLASGPGGNVTPLDTASSDALTYWFSFGAIAVVAFVLFILFIWPGRLLQKLIDAARADLLKENERLLARAEHAEQQRDEAMSIAQEKLVPLVATFTQTISALLPLMQQPRNGFRGDDRADR